jgi:anti-repressor protein
MNKLVKTNPEEPFPVDARELHGFLGSKQDFSHWVKAKVVNNPFFQGGMDYCLLDNINERTGRGGQNKIDYDLTINTAKKVSMAEQTEKGNDARDYFLSCEYVAKGIADRQLPDFTNPAIAARAWADEVDQKLLAESQCKKLSNTILGQAPIVKAHSRIAVAEGSLNMTASAKHLQVRPIDLKTILTSEKWIYRRAGNKNWLGYQNKVQQGLIEHKITTVSRDGNERVYEQFRITPKGLLKLAELIEKAAMLHGGLFKPPSTDV